MNIPEIGTSHDHILKTLKNEYALLTNVMWYVWLSPILPYVGWRRFKSYQSLFRRIWPHTLDWPTWKWSEVSSIVYSLRSSIYLWALMRIRGEKTLNIPLLESVGGYICHPFVPHITPPGYPDFLTVRIPRFLCRPFHWNLN